MRMRGCRWAIFPTIFLLRGKALRFHWWIVNQKRLSNLGGVLREPLASFGLGRWEEALFHCPLGWGPYGQYPSLALWSPCSLFMERSAGAFLLKKPSIFVNIMTVECKLPTRVVKTFRWSTATGVPLMMAESKNCSRAQTFHLNALPAMWRKRSSAFSQTHARI